MEGRLGFLPASVAAAYEAKSPAHLSLVGEEVHRVLKRRSTTSIAMAKH